MIRPIPSGKGIGFCSMTKMDVEGYDYQNVGIYHNYLFTRQNWKWPDQFQDTKTKYTIDGFSPNLNKHLHVGHLRNLATANAFAKMLPRSNFVALLGTSLGVNQEARQSLARWFDFLDYRPALFYDALMPWDVVAYQPGTGTNEGCQVFVHNDKEVITFRSSLVEWHCHSKDGSFYLREGNKVHHCPICGTTGFQDNMPNCLEEKGKIPGKPTYVHHDLAFAEMVSPDYYITGSEQVEHFKEIGLGEKHLQMGLVCGKDRKKLKSRTGDSALASDVFTEIKSKLEEGTRDTRPDLDRLAWNVICWNFLHCSRTKDVIYDPDKWTMVDSPGLYITYTHARLKSAINDIPTAYGLESRSDPISDAEVESALATLKGWTSVTEGDVHILGVIEYSHYWAQRALETLDTASFASYILDLCRVLSGAYEKERIVKGRPVFQAVMILGCHRLAWCMKRLGMFPLEVV